MIRSVFAPSRRMRKKAMASRAFLNGVEVTSDCQVADDKRGRVLLLLKDEEGRHYLTPDGSGVAKRWVYGRVEIHRQCWRGQLKPPKQEPFTYSDLLDVHAIWKEHYRPDPGDDVGLVRIGPMSGEYAAELHTRRT